MVSADDAVSIYQNLLSKGINVCITGGWGIDALLKEQTRSHKDIDLIVSLNAVDQVRVLSVQEGFFEKELWSENLWITDSFGNEIATAFLLRDEMGREIDIHAICFDEHGNAIPMWESDGITFKYKDLTCIGMISGFSVHCLSPEMQVA